MRTHAELSELNSVPIKIEQLNESLFAGLPQFARAVWDFPRDESFLRWLFLDAPSTVHFVAHKDGRWLAAIGAFLRRYVHADGPVECGEAYAWASLRTNESRGLGIKVLKAMMDRGQPLVVLGGSADTLNFMPRLGFETIASAPVLNLPLTPAAAFDMAGIKGCLVRLGIHLLGPALRPRQPRWNKLRNVPLAHLDSATLATQALPGFQATYTAEFFRWQTGGFAEVGTYLPFRFMREQEVTGWAFTRIAEEQPGVLVARILELKFAAGTTTKEHRAMTQAIVASLSGCGVAIVRALTTCPDSVAALRSLRFIARSAPNPALVFPAGRRFGHEPVRISVLRGDGGVLPLPTTSGLVAPASTLVKR